MANTKKRYIDTKFWNDTYVSELDPIEKLLFIYFLTNEHTNISGIYEVPLKIIGVETGIDTTMLVKMMPRLEDRVRYIDGYVVIKNFVKHQLGAYTKKSEQMNKGVVSCLRDLNEKWLTGLINDGFYELPQDILDALCIPYTYRRNYLDSDLDLDLDLDITTNVVKRSFGNEDINQLIDEFGRQFGFAPTGNKQSNRYAANRLIKAHGLEATIGFIAAAAAIQGESYAPVVANLTDLEKKLPNVASFYKRNEKRGGIVV